MDYILLTYAALAGINFGYGTYLLSRNSVAALNIGVGVSVTLLAVLSRMPVL